jgi:hypothetical protein
VAADSPQGVPLYQADAQRQQAGIGRAVMAVLQPFDGLTKILKLDSHDEISPFLFL